MAGIYKRGQTWWGRVQRDGKEYRQSLQTRSQSVARQRLAEWVAELERIGWGEKPRFTFNEVAHRFITEHLPTIRPQSARRYGVSLGHLDKKLGDMRLDEIGSAQLVEFETWRRSGGASAPTVRRDLACLSSLFSFAIEREWVETNPVGAFLRRAKRRGLREAEARMRYLTRDEEARLLTAAVPHARAAITFAIYSGLRQQEQFRLQWPQVDLAAGTVTIAAADAKGKRTRVVALLPPALEVLRTLPRHLRSRYVFWHLDGKRWLHMDRGLSGAARRGDVADLRWHDLRRTHGCRLIQEHDWSMTMVRDQLGHSSVAVTEKAYAFLEVEHRLARAGNRAGTVPAYSVDVDDGGGGKSKERKGNGRS